MSWLEILTLAILPAFLGLDFIHQARAVNTVRWWRIRAFLVTIAAFALSTAVAAGWALALDGYSLLKGDRLGTAGGAIAGVLLYELCHYAYHRFAHHFMPLWRVHQMHHSAESLDVWGAYYLHPLDVVFFTTWSALVMFPILGLSAEAGGIAVAFITFCGIFQHANISTPHWLGYLVQRPESHVIHHAKDVQHCNYADLPLIDMIFGTFHNPRSIKGIDQGFYFGASRRLVDALLLRDVTSPDRTIR